MVAVGRPQREGFSWLSQAFQRYWGGVTPNPLATFCHLSLCGIRKYPGRCLGHLIKFFQFCLCSNPLLSRWFAFWVVTQPSENISAVL